MTKNISIYKFLKTFVQVETNKVLHAPVVEDRLLVAGFETALVAEGRFERVGCTKFLEKLR